MRLIASVLCLFAASSAHAIVINSADVAGYSTFQDSNTGRVWADLDNFFDATASVGMTPDAMISAVTSAGFTFATRADVEGLLNSLPLGGGQWASYAAIMGYGIPRQLIWGVYNDGGNPYGWAFSFSTDTTWGFADNQAAGNQVASGNSAGARDLGIFAYRSGAVAVPEPSSLALLGLGFAAFGVYRRRRVS